MAEEIEPQEEKSKTPWLAMALVAMFCSAGGAGGVILLTPAAPQAEAAQTREAAAAAVAPFSERVLELDPFVVNVGDEGYPRYLKLTLAFEVDTPETLAELEDRVPQVRDMTILLLSSKRLSELSDFEGKALLKEDLRSRVAGLVDSGGVESVLFTEFVVQ